MKTATDRFYSHYKKRNKNVWVTRLVAHFAEEIATNHLDDSLLDEYKKIIKTPDHLQQTPLSQLAVIEGILKPAGVIKVLEVGTFRGFTTMFIAQSIGPKAIVKTIEVDPKYKFMAEALWKRHGYDEQIECISGDGVAEMEKLKGNFDLIYIDGDIKQYPAYYEEAIRLCKPNGLILINNILAAGLAARDKTGNPEARILRKLSQKIAKANHRSVSLIPAWDGLLIIVK